MKALLKMVLVLVGFVSLGPALAQPPKAPAQAPSVYDTITAKGCKIKVAAAWIENDGGGLCERIGFRGQIRKGCVVDIRIEIERRDGC